MVARVVLTATFLLVSAHPAAATMRCKAKMLRGRIVVTASEVTGTPRWGTRYGAETSVFEDTASCAVAGRLRNCPLAPAGEPDDTTPPAGCTIYVADDGPSAAARGSSRCVPSSEPPPCPILPADDIWNRDVSALPVHPMSDTWVASIGADSPLHPDFGAGLYRGAPIGIPYVVVAPSQPKVPIDVPLSPTRAIPARTRSRADAPIEGGGDEQAATPRAGRRQAGTLQALRALRGARLKGTARVGRRLGRASSTCARTRCAPTAGPRRRRRPADPPRPRALRRGRRRRDQARAALHRAAARSAPTSGRRATTPARRPIPRSRRWACASASRRRRHPGFSPPTR